LPLRGFLIDGRLMTSTSPYGRDRQWERLESAHDPWDIAVIGGGATGVGIAVDAASRGYRVALCEQHDFGKGTSSRSTKLVHGGVRYLQQGHIGLVRSALRERGLLLQNAPHLVRPLPTIVPLYAAWERPYYGMGMKVYDWLSGRLSFGKSKWLSAADTLQRVPTLQPDGLRGGILYWDAQFDDARLLVNMVQTAIDCGAVCVNYSSIRDLVKRTGRVEGFVIEDVETGKTARLKARVVVNATGPFSDFVRRLDDPTAAPAIATSQGIHLMFAGDFLPGETALMVPRTRDGRIIFAIPWQGRTMVGTTDTPLTDAPLEPRPQAAEIDFLLETVAPYLSRKPQAADIRAIFTGIRPLVRRANVASTKQLGRDHVIDVSRSGLVSIIGGKWTTYRKMAEDCVDRAIAVGGLSPAQCRTNNLPIHGAQAQHDACIFTPYGSDDAALEQLCNENPAWGELLIAGFSYRAAQVIWAARREMARTIEDVLARRLRLLFLDAQAAITAAPRVAELLAAELARDHQWQVEQIQQFREVAAGFLPGTGARSSC
jgi:glycerol-3-phosphate dehydrogenase